jgi:hypothetical protein
MAKKIQPIKLMEFHVPDIVKNGDLIQVYYLEAPLGLLPQKLARDSSYRESKLFQPNGYHSGVGFSVMKSNGINVEFATELTAESFDAKIFIPNVVRNESGDPTGLEWKNKAVYNILPIIDRNYWYKSTFICTITGKMLRNLLEWIKYEYIPRNTMYVLFSVFKCNITPDLGCQVENVFDPILKGTICDDYGFDIFKYLQSSLRVPIEYITTPDYTAIGLSVDNPNNVKQLKWETDSEKIINYYIILNRIIDALLTTISDAMAGNEKKAILDFTNLLKNMGILITNDQILKVIEDISALKKLDMGDIVREIIQVIQTGGKVDPKDNIVEKLLFDIYSIITLFTHNLKTPIMYYGYSADRVPTYFYIEDPQGVYVNYLENNLQRDLPSRAITGEIIRDKYTLEKTHAIPVRKDINFVLIIFVIVIVILLGMLVMKK